MKMEMKHLGAKGLWQKREPQARGWMLSAARKKQPGIASDVQQWGRSDLLL